MTMRRTDSGYYTDTLTSTVQPTKIHPLSKSPTRQLADSPNHQPIPMSHRLTVPRPTAGPSTHRRTDEATHKVLVTYTPNANLAADPAVDPLPTALITDQTTQTPTRPRTHLSTTHPPTQWSLVNHPPTHPPTRARRRARTRPYSRKGGRKV